MMPVVRVSEATYQKLKQFATPFEDTPDAVIGRLADAALAGQLYQLPQHPQGQKAMQPQDEITSLEVEGSESLAHTVIISAQFGGTPVSKPNWNTLAKTAHETAFIKLGSLDALRRATNARLREGRYEDEGFGYLSNIDLSVQGMDSNQAWENTLRLAQAIGVSVEVTFVWRNNPKAAKPGQTGTRRFEP